MPNVALDDLLDHIRVECSRCPEDVMKLMLIGAIRDFCRNTRAWVYEVENESILQGVSDYDIELPNTSAYPIAIEYLSVDGTECRFKSTDWLDRNSTNWRHADADDFRYFTHVQPKQITFPCVPTVNGTVGGVYYRVSLQPTLDATEIDSVFSDEWQDVFIDGAKADLLSMSAKPWSDPRRAGELKEDYRVGKGNARIRVQRSFGNSQDRWVGPRVK